MDELARFNRERWNALVEAGIEYSRPWLDLTPETAQERLESVACDKLICDVRGKDVLCLANGGGQQSAAFALLGARVAVLDLSDAQLAQDRRAAEHYSLDIRIAQGDMRDLSRFSVASFDLVCHWYSINFVPDPRVVFAQVARVIKPGGLYWLQFSNPHRFSLRDEAWRDGYVLSQPYGDGEAAFASDDWDVEQADGSTAPVRGPREFSHSWATIFNGLIEHGFVLRRFSEWRARETTPEVGSWNHLTTILPPYITVWLQYQPIVNRKSK